MVRKKLKDSDGIVLQNEKRGYTVTCPVGVHVCNNAEVSTHLFELAPPMSFLPILTKRSFTLDNAFLSDSL